jgi:hypothetical protein
MLPVHPFLRISAPRATTRRHDAVKAKGYDVGLANSSVYRELRDGYVALVAGPYATREGAADALADLRRDAAHDAFINGCEAGDRLIADPPALPSPADAPLRA